MANDTDSVDVKSLFWTSKKEQWEKIAALRSGTAAMRKGEKRWLPIHEKETPSDYTARLKRTVLYPGLDNAISRIVAKPFSKQVFIQDEEKLPDQVKEMLKDVDGTGTSFHEFMREVFDVGNEFGMCHVVVDFTATGGEQTSEEDKKLTPKLYAVKPSQVLGSSVIGDVLQEVRIHEQEIEPEGRYGEKVVDRIRVFTREAWSLYKKTANKWEAIVEDEPHSFGEVPLFTYYVKKTGFMTADPPHEHLAEVNLTHWRSDSEQRTILHYIRVPILHASGFKTDESKKLSIAPNSLVVSANYQARLQYVEHGGFGVEAGQNDLDNLVETMLALGLQPMMPSQSGDIKATGLAINESQSQSEVQSWIRLLEFFGLEILKAASNWQEGKVPDSVVVKVHNDFVIGLVNDSSQVKILLEAHLLGIIDKTTLLNAFKRHGILSEDADIDDIIQKAIDEVGVEPESSETETEEEEEGEIDAKK